MKLLRFGLVLALVLIASTWLSLSLGLGDDPPQVRHFILTQLRLPRLLIGFLVGATLAAVGASFQTIFQNPLATPSTVGTTAGATLGALLALVFGLSGAVGLSAVTLSASLGALAASSLVFSVASNHRFRVEEILLAGIAITLAAGAIAQVVQSIAAKDALFAAAQWSLGQLPQVGYDKLLLLVFPALLSSGLLLTHMRALAALRLGEERARSFGVDTLRVRKVVLLAGCLGVGSCVALCGPIAFVGLLVPHLVRRAVGEGRRDLLLLSWWAGGVFLLASDTLARHLIPGHELPVGVLTASLGAPLLFLLILGRDHRRSS